MERQLDHRAALMLQRGRGQHAAPATQAARIAGNSKIEGSSCTHHHCCRRIVVAVGIRAGARWRVRPSRSGAGSWSTTISKPTPPASRLRRASRLLRPGGAAYEQALLAQRLAGERASYPGNMLATNLKVSGVNVFSAGDFLATAEAEDRAQRSRRRRLQAGHRGWSPRRCGAVRRPPMASVSRSHSPAAGRAPRRSVRALAARTAA